VRQAGWPDFVLGNPLLDEKRFQEVRSLAERFWSDPKNRESFRQGWAPGAAPGGEDEFLGLD
jgi:hypothetical protein